MKNLTCNNGNTWVSDYSWGWALFYYGGWRYSVSINNR